MPTPRVSVLVADDSEDNQFLLRMYSQRTMFDLTFVGDGQQAIAAFRNNQFGVVVMDIQMPVMDGLEATRAIRSLEAVTGTKRTPIVALSANIMPNDVKAAAIAGCDQYLAKPISKAKFLSALTLWSATGGGEETPSTFLG